MQFFACLSRLEYTSYIISFISLCKILCYKAQRHFGSDAMLTADIAASMFRILTGLDEYSSPQWQLLCTNQHGPISLEDFNLLRHCCDNLKCCLLNDNPTNAHLQKYTFTYYPSATCFGHLHDHHQRFF